MKKLAKMLGYIMTLSMLAGLSVYAEEAPEVYAGSYVIEENQISVQLGHNLGEEAEPEFSMKLGGDALEMLSVEEGAPSVSYIYLIDISGSVKTEIQKGIEDVFNNMIAFLDEDDNAALMFVGDSAEITEFTNDKDALVEAFNKKSGSHEDTNLYYGIDQAVKTLTTNADCYDRGCLVILSDGEDDKIDGITLEEVAGSVEKAGVPVCCINIFNKNVSDETIEKAKLTGSLSRRSPGGFHLVYGENDMDGAATAARVKDTAENYYVAAASLDNYQQGNTNTRLEITMEAGDKGSTKTAIDIEGSSLPKKEVETPEPEMKVEEGKADYRWLLPVAGILIVIFVVILLVLQKKNKAKQARLETEYNAHLQEQLEEQEKLYEEEKARLQAEKEVIIKEIEVEVMKEAEPPHYSAKMILKKMGKKEDEILTFTLTDSLTIGRNPQAVDLALPGDDMLSGKHCILTCNEYGVLIEDAGSTNGTYLNGVAVTQRRRICTGDTLQMGGSKWRVEIHEC